MTFSIRSFLLLTAGCIFLGFGSNVAMAGKIPLTALAGTYTQTGSGSFAICTGPDFKEKDCSKFMPVTDHFFPQTIVSIGEPTVDAKGNACNTITQTISDFPVDSSPPIVQTIHAAAHIKSYDPSTGVGDSSGTTYSGGSCNGAIFNNKGATKIGTVSVHFVASDNGKRIDEIATALQDLIGGIGDFSITATDLKRP